MTDPERKHAEPPSFAKWLMWLFRRKSWKETPLIASVTAIITASVAVTAIYSAAQLIATDSPQEKPKKIRVGIKQFVGYTPLAVASEMNLFDGVNVEFVTIGDLLETQTRFEKGEIDAVMWLVNWHADYTARGNQAQVVLKLDTSLGADAILAHENTNTAEKIREILDSGKHIDVAVQLNEPSHYLIREFCSENNFEIALHSEKNEFEKAGKIYYRHATPSQAADRLLNGGPDGTVYHAVGTYEPYISELKSQGMKPLISGADRPDSIVDVLAVSPDFLNANQDLVEALIRGWFSGVTILRDKNHPRHKEAVDLARRFNYVPPDNWTKNTWNSADWPSYKMMDKNDYFAAVTDDQIRFGDRAANRQFFQKIIGGNQFHKLFRRAQDQLLDDGKLQRTTLAVEADGSQNVFHVFSEKQERN